MLILVSGGAGSGKSEFAEGLVTSSGLDGRVYLATMKVWAAESVRRVERHRQMRAGKGFETLECPENLADAVLPSGCAALLAMLETEDADPTQAADFAVQYLPNAMQYLMACSHEGCPANAARALAHAACACERQLDALAAGEYVTFEQEYYAMRGDLQAAGAHRTVGGSHHHVPIQGEEESGSLLCLGHQHTFSLYRILCNLT